MEEQLKLWDELNENKSLRTKTSKQALWDVAGEMVL